MTPKPRSAFEAVSPIADEDRLRFAETGGSNFDCRRGALREMVKKLLVEDLEQQATHQGRKVECTQLASK